MDHYKFDPPLTEHGYLTAEFMGHAFKLANYHPEVIYSSPELRCVQTSVAISRAYGNSAKICLEPALSDWVQLAPPQTPLQWLKPDQYRELGYPICDRYRPFMNELPKSESPEDYLRRLAEFFRAVSRPAPQVIIIVANANALELARNHHWQTAGQICEMKRSVRNCGICEIRVSRDKKVQAIEPNVLPFTKTLKEARGKIAT
ncbi:phosphoglycerate mutase family protein [Cooperia oncophora]